MTSIFAPDLTPLRPDRVQAASTTVPSQVLPSPRVPVRAPREQDHVVIAGEQAIPDQGPVTYSAAGVLREPGLVPRVAPITSQVLPSFSSDDAFPAAPPAGTTAAHLPPMPADDKES